MTRIVAGAAGGRRLRTPAGSRTRPTGERVREALMSSLGELAGRRVLDLFAGTGAVGLEALSRGAAEAVLVESDRAALEALRANVAALALPGATVLPVRVEQLLAAPPSGLAFDLVFLDPPYELAVDTLLDALAREGWLAPGAAVVVERATRGDPPVWPPPLRADRSRKYGDTTLWYGRRS